jgi:hypothetical protein
MRPGLRAQLLAAGRSGGGGGGGGSSFEDDSAAVAPAASLSDLVTASEPASEASDFANPGPEWAVERIFLSSLRDPARMWWWPVVYDLLGRKLLLALLLGLVHETSPLLPVGVFAVLVVSAVVHHAFRPSVHSLDNMLEGLVMLVTVGLFLFSIVAGSAAMLQGGANTSGSTSWAISVVSLVHIAMWVVLVGSLSFRSRAEAAFARWCCGPR